jgi:hypothetical protein
MNQRLAWRLAGLAAVCLSGAGICRASVQARDTVCWLGTGDWQLREKAGEVLLAKCRWDRSARLPKDKRHLWYVSAPTIRAESGRFLASDPEGRSPTVRLVDDQGAHTRWVFEFVSHLRPGPAKDAKGLKEGPAGFTFRVKAAEGPFKGWYLAAEDPPAAKNAGKGQDAGRKEGEGRESSWRRLRLVRDVREATVFTYIEVNYFVR